MLESTLSLLRRAGCQRRSGGYRAYRSERIFVGRVSGSYGVSRWRGGEKGYIPVIDYVDDIIILETMDPTSIQDISACIAVLAIECPFEGSVMNCTCGMADRDTVRLGGVS